MSDNSSQLERIFDLATAETNTTGTVSTSAYDNTEIDAVLDNDDADSLDVVSIEIDAKKAASLNRYVQRGLHRLYHMATNAADNLCSGIAAGDHDARTIEGTARLVESAIKAMTEINRYNMFLQEQMVDMRVRSEIEKLRLQAEKQRTATTREALLQAIKDVKDKSQDV